MKGRYTLFGCTTLTLSLLCCGLMATCVGCTSSAQIQQSAQDNALKYMQDLGVSVSGAACSGSDSDKDGYTSCTVMLTNGDTKSIECGYEMAALPDMFQNRGCKMAQPITIDGNTVQMQ